MNKPIPLTEYDFQHAWVAVIRELSRQHWSAHNLMVHIESSTAFDQALHNSISAFMKRIGVLSPKQVAYTIFPQGLYRSHASADHLFKAYNRDGGFFHRVHRRAQRWGTYFHRMTHYDTTKGTQNQLVY